MAEKWESDSLRWIHEVRAENYRRTKHIPLRKLPVGLSQEAKSARGTAGSEGGSSAIQAYRQVHRQSELME